MGSLDKGIRCWAARVERNRAEEVRKRLLKLNILNPSLKPFEKNGFIYFPLKDQEKVDDILGELNVSMVAADFEERPRRPKSLEELLSNRLPKELLDLLPSSYDLILSLIYISEPTRPY